MQRLKTAITYDLVQVGTTWVLFQPMLRTNSKVSASRITDKFALMHAKMLVWTYLWSPVTPFEVGMLYKRFYRRKPWTNQRQMRTLAALEMEAKVKASCSAVNNHITLGEYLLFDKYSYILITCKTSFPMKRIKVGKTTDVRYRNHKNHKSLHSTACNHKG